MPPNRKTAVKRPAPQPEPPEPEAGEEQWPPFWVADRILPVADEMGEHWGPVRAFNPGDPVPLAHVEQYGWQDYVHAPAGDWPAPEPAPEPEPDKPAGDADAGGQASDPPAGDPPADPGTEQRSDTK